MIKCRGIILIADGHPDSTGDQILKENIEDLSPFLPVFEDARERFPFALAKVFWEEERLICEFEVEEDQPIGKLMAWSRDNFRPSVLTPAIIGLVKERDGTIPKGIKLTGVTISSAVNADKRIKPIWVVT